MEDKERIIENILDECNNLKINDLENLIANIKCIIENKNEENEEINEFEQEVERLYNEWIEKEEKRNISYGEIAYIQSLSKQELEDLYQELIKELESEFE